MVNGVEGWLLDDKFIVTPFKGEKFDFYDRTHEVDPSTVELIALNELMEWCDTLIATTKIRLKPLDKVTMSSTELAFEAVKAKIQEVFYEVDKRK